jgi:ATP/maltotriose-dependent transcriptional regulator MalT
MVEYDGEVALVLDDFHLVESPLVDQAIDYLLANMPDNFHLAILSRIDPSISLSRLRVSDHMIELRRKDLRFSTKETLEYFNRSKSLNLSMSDVADLNMKTEGWIAGLQLIGISAQYSEDPASFIRSYNEAADFVLDYLSDEVFSGQQEAVQDFLIQTSILNRFTAPLCDVVTRRNDANEMIDYLVHQNLFIIPLDGTRQWYRYHHLFADLLRQRLNRYRPDTVPELHDRACTWYWNEDLFEEAFHHACLTDNRERAIEILERRYQVFVNRGEFDTLKQMLESLGAEITMKSAPLNMAWCWYYHQVGPDDSLIRYLDYTRQALQEREGDIGETPMNIAVIPSLIQTMESAMSYRRGELQSAKAYALKAISLIPDGSPPTVQGLLYAPAGFWLAQAHRDLGETDQACVVYLKLVELLKVSQNQLGATSAIWEISKLYEASGRNAETITLCRESLEYITSQGWSELPPTGVVHLVLAISLQEDGDLHGAQSHLETGRKIIAPIMNDYYRSFLREAESRVTAIEPSADGLVEPLSEREIEILKLVAQGLSNHDIGERLFLALSTVKGHNQSIFEKLNVKRRTEAVAYARNLGIL